MSKKKGFYGKNKDTYNVLAIGIASGLCVGFGIMIGLFLDNQFNIEPIGIVFGVLLGLIASVVYMNKQLNKNLKRFERGKSKFKRRAKKKRK